MKHARKFLIATAVFSLTLMAFMAINAQKQSAKKEAVGEVDQLVAELHKKNEQVVRACLEHCDSQKHANQELTVVEFNDRVQPKYPAIARAAHASGNVEVLVLIDEEGKVIAAQSVNGHPLLQAAAVQAAKASTFHPYRLNGQPVKISGTILYRFLL